MRLLKTETIPPTQHFPAMYYFTLWVAFQDIQPRGSRYRVLLPSDRRPHPNPILPISDPKR